MSRLDVFLAEKGYFSSRSKAQSAIASGIVSVAGAVVTKASFEVDEKAEITLLETDKYVSRGAYKLAEALSVFGVSASGKVCLDIGASTGGFTQVLLESGARRVYALDVGKNQLADSIKSDSRVISRENLNCRYLTRDMLGEDIELAVMDVSFISQALIYPAVSRVLKKNAVLISLIKPQFEAGRESIGKNGIVKDENGRIIEDIVQRLKSAAAEYGMTFEKYIPSPISGGDGNKEYLALIINRQV